MTALDKLKRYAGWLEQGRNQYAAIDGLAALIAEFEQRERKTERLIAAVEALDEQGGELANIIEDDLGRNSVPVLTWDTRSKAVDEAVADLQADNPPPIARDPVQDAPRRFWT